MKVFNFYAGPAILPEEVFKKASEAVLRYTKTGLSILEISHRSSEFVEIMEEAQSLAKDLLNVPEGYEVLFLQGGASTQFLMTAMNLVGKGVPAGFIDTGSWSSKAIKEARLFGEIEVLASSKEANYSYIPKDFHIPENLKYVHLTSNNTIFGTQFHDFPRTSAPLVADMSSDIFSRPIDVSRFGLLYAGAQKNMGPAGTTVVIVRDEFVQDPVREVPTMMNYTTHIAKSSMFNTPPVFAVYVSLLTLQWVKNSGGVVEIDKKNKVKADLLYETIDNSSLFYGPVRKEDRSRMNVVFLIRDERLSNSFLQACEDAGCIGVKGHRSVGGYRASIYNAMSPEGVERLSSVIQEFDQTHG